MDYIVHAIASVIMFFKRLKFEGYNVRKYGVHYIPTLEIGRHNNAWIDHKHTYYIAFSFIFWVGAVELDVKHQNEE